MTFLFFLFKISLINATFKVFFPGLLVIILLSGQKGTGDAEGSGYQSYGIALASCDSTRGSYAGTTEGRGGAGGGRGAGGRGARQRGPGTSAWPSLRPWTCPGGSILCFPFQLIFYISFRLSAVSQARKREAPAGDYTRAGLRWEHRVTPLMKGRDGLARLQGGHLLLDQRQPASVRILIKKKKKKKKDEEK